MLTLVFPATDVLADSFLRRRRRGELPFFIILLLAIASRRGRSTLRYTLRKVGLDFVVNQPKCFGVLPLRDKIYASISANIDPCIGISPNHGACWWG